MTPLGPKNAGLSSWGVGRRPPRVEGLPPPRPPRAARRVCDGISQATGSAPRWRRKRTRRVQVEEEEPTGYIRFEKFIPVMTTVLLEKRYRPIAEDVLLRAFEVLDPTKRGFLTKDELVKYMTEEGVLFPWRLPLELELHGEPFSQEEMEEMLSAAIDPESNTINYRDYITMMVIDEN
ncbi:dynein regulatory complex protein 8 isoform X13 [Rattus norvegicus]|uniref:EF-hand calcium binding domain 2 n=1 Tax=Rattus norvegicus TaxID=10116 RepID=A0ABK0L9W3_RAT|nr:dynein regulatory complex protein 8 isoform X2 [Rattus norvegicus]